MLICIPSAAAAAAVAHQASENRWEDGHGIPYADKQQSPVSTESKKPTCVSVLMECRTQGAICRASESSCNTCSEVTSCDVCRLSSKHDIAPGRDLRAGWSQISAEEVISDRSDKDSHYL